MRSIGRRERNRQSALIRERGSHGHLSPEAERLANSNQCQCQMENYTRAKQGLHRVALLLYHSVSQKQPLSLRSGIFGRKSGPVGWTASEGEGEGGRGNAAHHQTSCYYA